MNSVKNKKGFTLIELLVAVVILGIITVMAIPQISNLLDSNDKAKFETYEETIETSAKLYTDSYNEDMFGNNDSGCYDIPYEDLSNKKLIKDINISDVTCTGGAEKKTFVRVYKSGQHYKYKVSIFCTGKGNNDVQYSNLITGETCDGTLIDNQPPTMSVGLVSGHSLEDWMTGSGETVKVTISDNYGLLENIKVRYAWSTSATLSGVAASEWKNKSFGNDRYTETVEFSTAVPSNKNGDFYLHVEPDMVRDANGNYQTEAKSFGPFKLDNTKPKCEITLSSQPTGTDSWYIVKPTVTMTIDDTHGDIQNYGMAPKANPGNNEYEKILSKVQGDTTGVVWSGYVVDKAGNRSTCTIAEFKVDTTAPTKPSGGSIAVSGSTASKSVSAVSGSSDATSGILEYRYIIKNKKETPGNTNTAFTTSRAFTRSCGTSYHAYAIAVDKAGNKSEVHYIGGASDAADSYSSWSTCTKSCGGGTQTRTNTCALITTGLSQSCNARGCCDSVTYSDWTAYSNCSAACDGGTKTRTRKKTSAYDGKTDCGTETDTVSCNTTGCCSDGNIKYENGTSCTKKCGGGTYNRIAYSKLNGQRCSAYDSSSGGSECNKQSCCSSTTATASGSYSSCSASCGGGYKYPYYYYYSKYDGSYCSEGYDYNAGTRCNTQGCCSSTTATASGSYSSCSKTCGGGTKYPYYYYYSKYDGSYCSEGYDYNAGKSCNTHSCCTVVKYSSASASSTYCWNFASTYMGGGANWNNGKLSLCTDKAGSTGCVKASDSACGKIGGTYMSFKYCP